MGLVSSGSLSCLGIVCGAFCIRIKADKKTVSKSPSRSWHKPMILTGVLRHNNSGSDSDGHPVIRCEIKDLDGFVCAMASHQDVLGKHLDKLLVLILDFQINQIPHKAVMVANTTVGLNLFMYARLSNTYLPISRFLR